MYRDDERHMMPRCDPDHIASPDCWCRPVFVDKVVWIHFSDRERQEAIAKHESIYP